MLIKYKTLYLAAHKDGGEILLKSYYLNPLYIRIRYRLKTVNDAMMMMCSYLFIYLLTSIYF